MQSATAERDDWLREYQAEMERLHGVRSDDYAALDAFHMYGDRWSPDQAAIADSMPVRT